MESLNQSGKGMLILVATPIGNLGDMSPRGIETLASADAIAAEDTRTAMMLLQKFGITGKRMIPNHKFNEAASAGRLIAEMQSGARIALVTDAGMPCISDPGYLLVRGAAAAGIPTRFRSLLTDSCRVRRGRSGSYLRRWEKPSRR